MSKETKVCIVWIRVNGEELAAIFEFPTMRFMFFMSPSPWRFSPE